MTRSGVRDRLSRAVAIAEQSCPSLRGQRVSPHTIRHSTAVHLLQSGTDLAVIALWFGHSSPAVTHQYLEADLATKEATLSRLEDPKPGSVRFRPRVGGLAILDLSPKEVGSVRGMDSSVWVSDVPAADPAGPTRRIVCIVVPGNRAATPAAVGKNTPKA